MRTALRTVGIASVVALIAAAGLTFYVFPNSAVSATIDTLETPAHAERVTPRLELAQAAPPATPLPGGASSLNETYKDWQVSCAQQGTVKRCTMSQQQVNQESRQRVLAIEINAVTASKVEGLLVLPFGLALDAGAKLQIDDGGIGQPTRFRTCLPAGCLIPLSFDTATVVNLRKGTTLKVVATADGGAATPFSISLQGFGTALDRIAALSR
jgi:invasion protein IalB